MNHPYTGVWRRASLQLGQDPPTEMAYVYWVQAGEFYADLRIPYHFTPRRLDKLMMDSSLDYFQPLCQFQAFAGRLEYRDNHLQWHHELDFSLSPQLVDHGSVTWDGLDLIESGEWILNHNAIPYQERWIRESDSDTWMTLQLDTEDNLTRGERYSVQGLWIIVGSCFLRLIDFRDPDDKKSLPSHSYARYSQFQADFGTTSSWLIQLSNWPSRVGQGLVRQLHQTPHVWTEKYLSNRAEWIERTWRLLETSG